MAEPKPIAMPAKPDGATGVLVLANGEVAWGRGFGAEGAAVARVPLDNGTPTIAYRVGEGSIEISFTDASSWVGNGGRPTIVMLADGRSVLASVCQSRFGEEAALLAWRPASARAWDEDDTRLLAAAGKIVRMALEHEAIQREMLRTARTDPLTGLLNRRAFREEVMRHTDRTDRESLPSTVMYVDLDHFKSVNDRMGHEVGDQVLVRLAVILRETFRPADLIARLGGDEFAVWMGGADHMTAAERAEALRARQVQAFGHYVHLRAAVAAKDEDFAAASAKRGDFLARIVACGLAETECGERFAVAGKDAVSGNHTRCAMRLRRIC